jgi:hypothetical protein
LTTATSTDPVFAALSVGTIVAAFAAERDGSRSAEGASILQRIRPAALAATAGLLGGISVYFTYAAPLFLMPALLPVWRLIRHHRWGLLAAAIAGAGIVIAAVSATGFLLWQGLAATNRAYHAGVAEHRPYRYFIVANLVVLGISIGPAALAGAARGVPRRLRPLVLIAGIAVVFADLVGLSKGETERIWLPFVPWLTLGAVAYGDPPATARRWLTAQLIIASMLQLTLRSPW